MPVGVLAIQGGFREHVRVLASLNVPSFEVRTLEDLGKVEALILPGGESTAISKFLREGGMMEAIREKGLRGMPILGTCAGAILLAKKIHGQDQAHLGLIDIEIERNAYGRQLESFVEMVVSADPEGKVPDFQAAFIRAPRILSVGTEVEILGRCRGDSVAVRQCNILAATCHPEIVGDIRLHQYFLTACFSSM